MSERARILEMLKQGKVSVQEAEQLLDAVAAGASTQETRGAEQDRPARTSKPEFLRVLVSEAGGDCVDLRVPIQMLRAGVRLGALIPPAVRQRVDSALGEKGINLDLSSLTPETVDEFIEGMSELRLDISEADGNAVRIYCE